MGSSLINDSVFSHHLSKNLIQAAKTLFVTGESELDDAIEDVELDESDLAQIAKRTGT
jgi:phosphate:Na+ symporter